MNWFNTDVEVDNFLDNGTIFSNPIGTIAATRGEIRAGVTTWEDVIVNDTTIDNPNIFNLIFTDTSSSPSDGFFFQIGANSGQAISMGTVDITTVGLDISDANLLSTANAEQAISRFDAAIQKVSAYRSNYGALQNRLEHTMANLKNASENLQAAESRIRDVDMAKEVMEMTRATILGQASQAMLAQANQKPQAVLQLLG